MLKSEMKLIEKLPKRIEGILKKFPVKKLEIHEPRIRIPGDLSVFCGLRCRHNYGGECLLPLGKYSKDMQC